jgi:hypothetical protein
MIMPEYLPYPDHHRSFVASNPFSTRCTRPGAVPFHFAPGPKEKQLFERLWDMGLWGQIVGSHGSGKSTLLYLLAERASAAGIRMVPFDLHDQQRTMPRGWQRQVWESFEVGRGTMLVVDGYEQLTAFAQWRLKRTCRHRQWGLLVTAHRDVGLPHLYRTLTHIDLAHALVTFMLPEGETPIRPELVAEIFRRHEGNLRNVFSDLYDQYEKLR